MKHFKRLAVILIVFGAGAAFFYFKSPEKTAVEATEALKVYYDVKKADAINSRPIAVKKDGEIISLTMAQRPYMTQSMELMIPVTMAPRLFGVTVDALGDGRFLLSLDGHETEAALGENTCLVDGKQLMVTDPLIRRNGTLYVSMELLAQTSGAGFSWDEANNQAVIRSDAVSSALHERLPQAYDMREDGRLTPVRDQGNLGTCWAFASLGALESALMPESSWCFSVDHMSFFCGYNMTQLDGGDFNMSLAYLTSWRGPVAESDDPYGDGVSDEGLSSVVHLQEAVNIETKDYETIKQMIYTKGGVQSSFYSDMESATGNSSYYNAKTNAYFYPGANIANHDIVIVGWDDLYPKENFNVYPENDGAFLCRNSWGSQFGDDGYFYISYEDTNIGADNLVFTRTDPVGRYDCIYQSDLLGWVGTMGYGEPSAWFANVYTASGEESLEAAAFYATGPGSSYDLYTVSHFTDSTSFDTMNYVKSGYIDRAGYYTVDFKVPVSLEAGEHFAVVLYLTTPGSERPVAIEYETGEWTSSVDITDGEGYLSYNGTTWENIESTYQSNACLKAFTKKAGS